CVSAETGPPEHARESVCRVLGSELGQLWRRGMIRQLTDVSERKLHEDLQRNPRQLRKAVP
ncbi:MAG TPA: hypothetical protein VGG83_19010, partial [Trebonia sp.]